MPRWPYWWRRTPDGRLLKITLLAGGSWSVVIEGDEDEYLAPTVAEALTQATGGPGDAAWIRALQKEVEAVFAPPSASSQRLAGLFRRLLRSGGQAGPADEGRTSPTPPTAG